jgi:TolB-like protein/tetratricopeptide (TPR) repeat protein
MPLVNMSGDPDQNYLADGITEDIITDLSRWKQLRVLSRNSSFHFRHLAADLVKLRWDLGAAYVVAGSVHRLGDRLRLSIQLNETASGRQIWAERYDRSVDKAVAPQETIVRTMVGTLVGRIEAADRAICRRKNPASMDAYDCVLRGNGLPWIEPVASLEASDWYRKAIEIDPTYGRAYALLALQLETQWEYDESGSNTLLEQALELALKAVELDDNESTAFSVLGRIYLQRRCFDLAERYYRRAYDINPGNPLAIALMGDIEIHLGRSEMAVEWLEKAKSVDPYFDPEWYWPMRGLALYCARRYEEAIVAYGQSLRAPYWVPAYVAACHAQAGREDEAKAIMTELLRDVPSLNVPSFADGNTFRDEADFAHILEGMRKAGLPN